MMVYASEAEVKAEIVSALSLHVANPVVIFFKDEQGGMTLERTAVFRAAVAADESEAVVNGVCDIGTDTDRGIVYRGSQVEPTEAGEVRYLFFEAKINPFEER